MRQCCKVIVNNSLIQPRGLSARHCRSFSISGLPGPRLHLSDSLKVCDTASSPPELTQPSKSDAAIRASREEGGVSKPKGGSDAAEEYVTLPI